MRVDERTTFLYALVRVVRAELRVESLVLTDKHAACIFLPLEGWHLTII